MCFHIGCTLHGHIWKVYPCIHLQIGKFLVAMKTGGEEAIGVLPHAAIAHGVDPSAIVGMGNVLSSQKGDGHEVPA